MNRSAHLLCAIILTAACFACVRQPQVPASGRGTELAGCTAQQFADAVQVLSTNSFPDAWLYPPSVPTTYLNSSTQIWKDLVAAFNAAPNAAPFNFQQQLCLTTVYINPTSCTGPPYSCFGANSWALRDPYDVTHTKRYLALSDSLWNGGAQAPSLTEFETKLLAQVMRTQNMPWPPESTPAPKAPAFYTATNGGASVDKPEMAVLSALAHEYGHTLWFDVFKRSNPFYDPNNFSCKAGSGFFNKSWSVPVNTPPNWLNFAVTTNDQHASGAIKTRELIDAINQLDFAKAARLLNKLYDSEKNNNNSGVWASLFASISPSEDFVESFKIYVLTNPATNMGMPVTSMPLNIYSQTGVNTPTYTPDIFANLYTSPNTNKKELARKRACINDVFSSTTPPAR